MNKQLKYPSIPVPAHMRDLEITDKGYFKPWFVKADDFRVVDSTKACLSADKKACWICGKPFESNVYALVGDPISAMFLVFKEPPCHQDCAEYAMQVCPFILYPNAKRRTAGLDPDNTLEKSNENREIKIDAENPGQYYSVLVKEFSFNEQQQILVANEADVIQRQHWIGGRKQEKHPTPIVPFDELPQEIKDQLASQA